MKTKLFLPILGAGVALTLLTGLAHASTFGSIRGRVTDTAGKPVAGAKVTLAGGGSVATDKSGDYDLEGIDPGAYQMEAVKKGYKTSSASVTITQDVPQELDLTLSAQ